MWTVKLLNDPLNLQFQQSENGRNPGVSVGDDGSSSYFCRQTHIAYAKCSLSDLFGDEMNHRTVLQGGLAARVALADYVARIIATMNHHHTVDRSEDHLRAFLRFEALDVAALNRRTTFHWKPNQQAKHRSTTLTTPFVLERTDVAVIAATSKSTEMYELHVYLRVFVYTSGFSIEEFDSTPIRWAVTELIKQYLDFSATSQNMQSVMTHIAIAILQSELRSMLHRKGEAVAFVANGAILPRKSGASMAPMTSPPAIPFAAPDGSSMNQRVEVDMGQLSQFLVGKLPPDGEIHGTTVSLQGLIVPRGVTLIVGGGYHGKSTMLRCIATGVYNKVPGDGREFCVTVDDAVTVRAEDGRYVSNCNVSAFISNLPTAALDTQQFSTGEASGSTSQASNVVEAIEMGASAMLVDEDVSAANFMARDGRMRSLVMDESITPLLYRVNGLYATHGISSIVVVGGVGDWLDVPNNVILMDRYRCHDATAKARSISKQFSHGHVQYAGRGVVHRLQWDKTGTPFPRRPILSPPTDSSFSSLLDVHNIAVTLLDGSNSISFRKIEPSRSISHDELLGDNAMDDEEEQFIDMSRCEQLMGKKPHLYGCGLCVAWLLCCSQGHPELGMCDLLRKLDETLDEKGLLGLICKDLSAANSSPAWETAVETLGFVYRPRRFEVGQALTRFRGIKLEALPIEDDGADAAAKAEAERQRNELIAIWNNRRKRNPE
jgi:Predicted ATPase of the ABC class